MLNFSIANYRRVLDKAKLGAGIKKKNITKSYKKAQPETTYLTVSLYINYIQ